MWKIIPNRCKSTTFNNYASSPNRIIVVFQNRRYHKSPGSRIYNEQNMRKIFGYVLVSGR